MLINTTLEFKTALRTGSYAWPGGYPLFFICDDGGTLCCKCARTEAYEVMRSIASDANDGWRVVGQDVNWEDANLHCDNCGSRIESAYAED